MRTRVHERECIVNGEKHYLEQYEIHPYRNEPIANYYITIECKAAALFFASRYE